jgi:polysaccharide biosynthesis protein PslG
MKPCLGFRFIASAFHRLPEVSMSRNGQFLLVLLCCLNIVACTSRATTPIPRPATCQVTADARAYGINTYLFGNDTSRLFSLITIARFRWIRQQIHWRDIEGEYRNYVWEPLDQIVNQARVNDLQILLSIVRSPPWVNPSGGLPADDRQRQEFTLFVETLAKRYQGRVAAYQIWNEPNLAYENGGTPASAEQYLALLQAAYPAIRAADPCALVVSAAPAANAGHDPARAGSDLAFLEEISSREAGVFRQVADVIALHPGGGPHNPHFRWKPAEQQRSSEYFRHLERQYAILARYQDQRPIWITEVGWNVNLAVGAPMPVNEAEQAYFLIEALKRARQQYPWITNIFIWNLNFAVSGSPIDEKSGFGILRPDYSPRPAYLALQDFLNKRPHTH